ncbi:MAG TPA: hypothetical protein VLV17_05645 [Anaeromyxobacteraceae bacterium]|nr:hypothetical protein [Anaeromyxobacteraceae bacterium]
MWLVVCLLLGGFWVFAASSRSGFDHWSTAVRGVLGGLAALGLASIGYGLLQLAGLTLSWSFIAEGTWPALGGAVMVGLVEEGGKAVGASLATLRGRLGKKTVLGTTLVVASVFAVAEGTLALRGADWPVAVTRLALGPVAHGLFAAPFAVALAEAGGLAPGRAALRIGSSVLLSALLHGLGDFCLAKAGWGQAGFATTLLAPALWLYVRARPTLFLRWAVGPSAHSP